MIKCGTCNELKPEEAFSKMAASKTTGRQGNCKPCAQGLLSDWRTKNSDYYRKSHLLSRYGITPDEFDRLRADQEYSCAICGTDEDELDRQLHVDHNHKTGAVRGLLCHPCNVAIGMFKEDVSVLQSAIEYLNDYNPG